MRPRKLLLSSVLTVALTGTLGLASTGAAGAAGALGAADDPASTRDLPRRSAPALPAPERVGAPDAAALAEALTTKGPAASAPGQRVADGPLTGFEQRGGSDWTTLEEERRFLRQVDALSDKVSISLAGRTLEGRRLDLVQIGSGPRTQQQVAAGSSVLIACSQHGNEPAGREACLSMIRDLALDESPATKRLLENTTVLVVPTANPDGRAADTRGNSDGIDINRDHLALTTNEARAIAKIVRDYKPQVVHDAHEYGGARDVYDRDLIRLWPRNLNVDKDVRALAVSLADDYIDPAVQSEGYTTGEYGIFYGPDGSPIAQVAGDEDERIMRNTMGLKHSVGQLVESLVNDFDDDETETENKLRRVRTQTLSLMGTTALVLEKRDQLLSTTRAAAEDATAEGAAGDQPFFFAGADNDLPSSGSVDLSPPCAYTMTVDQLAQVRQTLTLHGVSFTRAGGVVTVSMAQPAQPLIPLLLDARANNELLAVTPVECG
ncbi:M14 family metallopeptidase [Terracoccus luteus]|uniref:Peptidase M14 domain-containing protein n=1 Tax=Terracoccus luteus TaxID=53356 RepID=A0A839PYH9_9MICO|nr:M14 family metallocarboxypeptidase [Terracoccus luteus]MBB2987075.1 hypothetical protein [Terracoccus luteus]MCP2172726.1 hypothetical protein [Terracoccus luteus]